MSTSPVSLIPILVALLLFGGSAHAQDSVPSLEFTGDVGLINASGNSDVTTVNVAERLVVTGGRLVVSQFFKVVYGASDGEVTTSTWNAGLRGDVTLSPNLALFGLVAWGRNTFAGIARRFEEAVGLSVRVLRTPKVRLEFEGGLSLVQQRSTTVVANDFAAGRVAGLFRRSFSRRTWVQQTTEFFPNLRDSGDYRLDSETAVVAPFSDHVALKVSYVIQYDHRPEPGFDTTDRLLTTGVQVTF